MDDWWFGELRVGPYGSWIKPHRPFLASYSRRDGSDTLHIKMLRKVRKEDFKVRYFEPDTIEVEISRLPAAQDSARYYLIQV